MDFLKSLITFSCYFYNQCAGAWGIFHGDLKIVCTVDKKRVTVNGDAATTLIPSMETVKEIIPGEQVKMILIVEKEVSKASLFHSWF
jgi:hypothetical protein